MIKEKNNSYNRFVLKGDEYNPIFIDTCKECNGGWIHTLSFEEVVDFLNKYDMLLRRGELNVGK